uniref:Ribosome binding protein 1 n=1 Tax=Latimeria chalumnae TaxID=7897 RepID=H3AXP4_LATCH
MDVYDPQTLGFMVFGGFMVISAIGIFLVSTFSMKETSYEEALAKQKKELEKAQQQKAEKKKKEKTVERKGKAKKKEDKPNGKIPEHDKPQTAEAPKEVEPVAPELSILEPPVVAVVSPPAQEKFAPSPKDKKKKEKKVAKVEPAPSPAVESLQTPVSKLSPVLETVAKEVPIIAVPPVGAQQCVPVSTPAPAKKAEVVVAQEELKQEGTAKKSKAAPKKKAEPIKNPICIVLTLGEKFEGGCCQYLGGEIDFNVPVPPESGHKLDWRIGKEKNEHAIKNRGKNVMTKDRMHKKAQKRGDKVFKNTKDREQKTNKPSRGKNSELAIFKMYKVNLVYSGSRKIKNYLLHMPISAMKQDEKWMKPALPQEGLKSEHSPSPGEWESNACFEVKKKGFSKFSCKKKKKKKKKKKVEGFENDKKKKIKPHSSTIAFKPPHSSVTKTSNQNQPVGRVRSGIPTGVKIPRGKCPENKNAGNKKKKKKKHSMLSPGTSSEGVINWGKKAKGKYSRAGTPEGREKHFIKNEGIPNKQNKKNPHTNPGKTKRQLIGEGGGSSLASSREAPNKEAEPVKSVFSFKNGESTLPTDAVDGPLYLPYKTLVSTISSMVFSEGEAQRLIEILMDKSGIVQDTWHTATQKGDPVTALKRQLEEKEKQLTAEQEDAAAAKNKLRELSKELSSEKLRTLAAETKLREQITAQEQEIAAVQARMQASYQDHVNETQQLQTKIRSLQEQLENGPSAQLARLQQENSILRDALNQATSQTESKQNAELAKLRQECSKLTKELSEKVEVLQQDEQQRKNLEAKLAASEKQINELQTSQQETEMTLQKRLDEVGEELHKSQSSYTNLLADLEKTKGEQQNFAELQAKVTSAEAEVQSKSTELESLKAKLSEASSERVQLEERVKSIEALLEAGRSKEAENKAKEAQIEQMQNRFQEKEAHVSALEKELLLLNDAIEQQKAKNNDLREKNWKAMEALKSTEKICEEKLISTRKAQEEAEQKLNVIQTQTKEALQTLFPQVTVSSEQMCNEWLEEFKQKALEMQGQQTTKGESTELALKLKEAEDSQSTLQAECDQYRSVLAETEGMLKDLQKSVEEEEHVWRAKLTASEEQLHKAQAQVKPLEETVEKLRLEIQGTEHLKEQVSLLEAQLENQLESAHSDCQNYSEEVAVLRELLSESQSQLDAAKTEAQKQSKELALVRQQLSEMKNHVHDEEAVRSEADPTEQEPVELLSQLEQTIQKLENEQALRQKLAEEFEEAQNSASGLQAELEKLRAAGDCASSEKEEAAHLKERLDKEKKLTMDLGQAATKLQQLLKTTQEQLTKEREMVKKLQEKLQEKGEDGGSKEGTSV